MRIAFATTFDPHNIHNWSGTPYHMAHAMREQGCEIEHVGPLKRKRPFMFKITQTYKKFLFSQRESSRYNIQAARNYSMAAAKRIHPDANVVLSPLINPIAYLDCKQPIVLWTDALYAGLLGFYPLSQYHSANTVLQANTVTRECLSRCELAIFSSEWAAKSAIELYGANKNKVKVIPFGANISTYPTLPEIQSMVQARQSGPLKLLFLGKEWARKGGDLVIAVAKALHEANVPVELNILGYYPDSLKNSPSYIKLHGFVSKNTPEGKQKINKILADSHFLFVPSRAEAYGIVFCEANAFGVPCLTTYVGGISTIVKDNVNGMTFSLDATVQDYCDYIVDLINDPQRYTELALSSYNEFTSRLNWQIAAKTARDLMAQL